MSTQDPTCRQVRELLDESSDPGELEQHLAECADCRAHEEKLRELAELARSLPREVAPTAELWPEIRSQIEVQPRFGATHLLRLAAGFLLIAGSASLLLFWQDDDSSLKDASSGRTTLAESVSPQLDRISISTASELARYEDHVLATRKDLLEAMARQGGLIDPELSSRIEADIEDLHIAIGEIRIALAENPDDSRLSLLLAAKFQQEAELVKRLNRIG